MVSPTDARTNQFISSKNPCSSSNTSATEGSKLQRPVVKSMRTVRSKIFQTDRIRSSDGSLSGNSAEIADNKEQFSGIYFSESAEIIETLKSSYSKPDLLDLSQAFSDFSAYSSDISGELQRLAILPGSEEIEVIKSGDLEADLGFGFLQRFSSRDLEAELGLGFLASENCSTEIFDSLEHRKLELAVKICVKGLGSDSIAVKRCAAGKLRLLAKNRPENRALIGRVDAIPPLVSLLHCHDPATQENAVTALLNLSLHESNKMEITAAGAIKPLVYVLKTGTAISKQNAACTLMSLSFIEDNKISIGAAGAIPLLVSLLLNGSSRGKKDALTTLYKLSSLSQNKERAIRAGAVKLLIELIADQASGMMDKAVVVLNNLATIAGGKTAIVEEGGIPVLVEVIVEGSMKGKEFAVATLLQLCSDSRWNRTLLVREGGIPPLVALSQLGTARAKHKALTLLRYLREPRQGMNLQEEPFDASSSP